MHTCQTLNTRLAETREAITQETSGQYWNERTVNIESDAKTMVVSPFFVTRGPLLFPIQLLVRDSHPID
jgi:hypothetical protein